MPTTKSAAKALKQSLKNRSRNRHFTALFKETVKSLETILNKTPVNKEESMKVLAKIYSCIDKLVKKNIIHKNN
jgi:ribosomal protein S20